jgi:signal transduction histidine kinase
MRGFTQLRRKFFATWPVAAAALGGLLLLIYTSIATTSRKAEEIYAQLDSLNRHHREVETKLRRLRGDVHLSGIYIRDYLLDTDRDEAPGYRKKLTELRGNHAATLHELRALAPKDAAPQIDALENRLDDYWQTFEPLFEWTIYEKVMRSARFLREEVVPRREAVLAIATDVEQINNTNLRTQRDEVSRRLTSFREDFHSRLWRTLLLGFVVSVLAVLRLRVLEQRARRQRLHAEEAERQMRLLSQQLVAAQEEERKKLTRELHDHVGQMLTALRMEIGRADRARGVSDVQLAHAIGESRRLLDTTMRSVRDLVMGLRPSMLDDFGLQPALDWHIREFRRRFSIRAELSVVGDLDALPDRYRTCVYRIVQEALTNSARHAQAKQVSVAVQYRDHHLDLVVADDGVGMNGTETRGVGLLGIEERVRELNGTFALASPSSGGTELHVTLPVTAELEEGPLARAAG